MPLPYKIVNINAWPRHNPDIFCSSYPRIIPYGKDNEKVIRKPDFL
jgi:hypothetical protein